MTPRINPIGISAHLEGLSQSDANKQLDLIQQAGINWIRLEFHWNTIEPIQGTWNFSKYDFLVSGILSRGMQIIGLLTQYHVPAWYGTPNNKPPLPQDYAAWVSSVASRYAGQIPLYEVGNEPNSNGNWYPSASASAYAALLKAAYPAIKSADPNAKVISAGLSQNNPTGFLTQMYASGAQGYFDYFGFHPYSQPSPPSFGILDNLRSIMANNGDENKKIMVTEVGWPTYSGSSGVTEANQAAYINQVYQMIMHGNYDYVPIACIYDFLDDGTDPNNQEHHFGLLRTDYSQKPAYSAMIAARNDYNASFTPINP